MNYRINPDAELRSLGRVLTGTCQDGAAYGDYIFRFDHNRRCVVFNHSDMTAIARFELDGDIVPHCNCVSFGTEFYADGDEFPLLYANVYNNYASADDRREGTVCIYRLERDGAGFKTTQVGLIRIGFVHDTSLWCSPSKKDVRPYGNLIVDALRNKLCVFVMRDEAQMTRHFIFNLPKLSDGIDENGLKVVTLTEEMIEKQFDTPYMRFMQGGAVRDGLIVSSEGFDNSNECRPRLRFIDCDEGRELADIDLTERGLIHEAEFVEFIDGKLYYADAPGNLYEVLI